MKKLPKKWAIKAKDRKQCKKISKWCNKNRLEGEIVYEYLPLSSYIHSKVVDGGSFKRTLGNGGIKEGFTKIKFKHFKKFILDNEE